MHKISTRLLIAFAGASILAATSSTVAQDAPKKPVLIAVGGTTGALEYWPISPTGGSAPRRLSGKLGLSVLGMAANGNEMVMANENPPQVVLYNIINQRTTSLPDPYGTPIDVAIDRNATLYVTNLATPPGVANVTLYPSGSMQPQQLICQYLGIGEAIAVDNEGNIFVNGYESDGSAGVVEIPVGPNGPEPQNCFKLLLKPEPGYVAAVAVDPKTDDLLVLDNPDYCAGGIEGRLTIYPKPYRATTGRSRNLGANCAGGMKLNADSSIVFVGDEDVSGSYTFILQRSYPGGAVLGTYSHGQPGAFVTIPNSLPN